MRHNHLKIRIWLALAVAIASLGFTSSAFARPYIDDSYDPSVTFQAPVVATPAGFSWSDAAVGAGVALAAAVGGIGIAYLARSHRRLAT
jgi:hypothetical protein